MAWRSGCLLKRVRSCGWVCQPLILPAGMQRADEVIGREAHMSDKGETQNKVGNRWLRLAGYGCQRWASLRRRIKCLVHTAPFAQPHVRIVSTHCEKLIPAMHRSAPYHHLNYLTLRNIISVLSSGDRSINCTRYAMPCTVPSAHSQQCLSQHPNQRSTSQLHTATTR